ncbi:CHAD domain-containing protein [Fulvivirga sp. 29W222]|uniref:CHAD domain-containing protein n=1 Tax=Fulvivirga marina TaxID=2494733 RepID=A0A937FTS1_9BACT|nr:CHAD domain-containing protein [Fulvivirga marina]MBL6445840.1 CHAD domain-containing protein [Fulvivirga marina]
MSLQLKRSEDFSTGITRLVKEQVQRAYNMLNSTQSSDRHEIIHELRKTFKILRAIFRLIKDEIGKSEYKKENIFYRDLGRQISEIRDKTAVIETMEQLQSQYSKEFSTDLFGPPIKYQLQERRKLENNYVKNNIPGYLKSQIDNKLKEGHRWNLSVKAFDQIAPSLKRVYKKGQISLKIAKASRATEDLHEWRKRVKYLRYQIDTLSRIWPGIMGSLEDELHDLSNLLGFDHDLSIVQKQISDNLVVFENPVDKALVMAIITSQRNQMQRHAFIQGQNCYYEKPAAFIGRIQAYWSNYEKKISDNESLKKKNLNY